MASWGVRLTWFDCNCFKMLNINCYWSKDFVKLDLSEHIKTKLIIFTVQSLIL